MQHAYLLAAKKQIQKFKCLCVVYTRHRHEWEQPERKTEHENVRETSMFTGVDTATWLTQWPVWHYLMVTISVCISDQTIHMMSILCVTSIPFMSNMRALVNRDVPLSCQTDLYLKQISIVRLRATDATPNTQKSIDQFQQFYVTFVGINLLICIHLLG